jgi:flagellar biosynthesis/type III secretory pathway protein FliH
MSRLLSTCTATGPTDLADLACLLHEANATAAAWLVERTITQIADRDAEIEKEADEREKQAGIDYEEAKQEGEAQGREEVTNEIVEHLRPIVRDAEALLEQKGRLPRADVERVLDQLITTYYEKIV